MQLYTLMFGKSKRKMRPIMIDELHKVEIYKDQREKTRGSKAAAGWHEIILALDGEKVWKKNNSNKWTGYNDSGPKIVK